MEVLHLQLRTDAGHLHLRPDAGDLQGEGPRAGGGGTPGGAKAEAAGAGEKAEAAGGAKAEAADAGLQAWLLIPQAGWDRRLVRLMSTWNMHSLVASLWLLAMPQQIICLAIVILVMDLACTTPCGTTRACITVFRMYAEVGFLFTGFL